MDDGEAIILDYSINSIGARWIRDELREVSSGLWLGKASNGMRGIVAVWRIVVVRFVEVPSTGSNVSWSTVNSEIAGVEPLSGREAGARWR